MPHTLTVAICIYNKAKDLPDCLQSVGAQTFHEFEWLLIDDCSTDDSLRVVEDFFKEHSRQHEIVRFEENRGVGYARHFAERRAKTKYMMFVDADDVLKPYAIEKMYYLMASDSDLMAVGCWQRYVSSVGEKMGGGIYLGAKTKEEFYRKAAAGKRIFMQVTAIYDRELALKAGGFEIEGYPAGCPRYQDYCEDLDLWTRMSDFYTDGKAIIVVPEVLMFYRKSGGLSSGTLPMIIKMNYVKSNVRRRRNGLRNQAFIEYFDTIQGAPLQKMAADAVAAEDLRNGVFYLRDGKWLRGFRLLLRSIVTHPAYFIDKLKSNLLH